MVSSTARRASGRKPSSWAACQAKLRSTCKATGSRVLLGDVHVGRVGGAAKHLLLGRLPGKAEAHLQGRGGVVSVMRVCVGWVGGWGVFYYTVQFLITLICMHRLGRLPLAPAVCALKIPPSQKSVSNATLNYTGMHTI